MQIANVRQPMGVNARVYPLRRTPCLHLDELKQQTQGIEGGDTVVMLDVINYTFVQWSPSCWDQDFKRMMIIKMDSVSWRQNFYLEWSYIYFEVIKKILLRPWDPWVHHKLITSQKILRVLIFLIYIKKSRFTIQFNWSKQPFH